MKSYNVKYSVGQEVYIISKKAIYKSKIDKIRVTEQRPYGLMNASPQQIEDAKEGISIDYLVVVESTGYGTNGSMMIGFDWYNQRDVFSERDELISQIK